MKFLFKAALTVLLLEVSHIYGWQAQSVFEEQLLALWTDLFKLDKNGLGKEIKLNLESKTTETSDDNAAKPLFQRVPFKKFASLPTYAAMLKLFDNYEAAVDAPEDVADEEIAEQDEFVDAILKTEVMRKAYDFLLEKARASPDIDDFAQYLKSIWFGLYSRNHGVRGSSGFEHVFLGELGVGVNGMHSWIRYALEEKNGDVDYLGYLDITSIGDDYVIELPIQWRKAFNNKSSMFVGTSPELEMAIYTVCFTLMPNQICPIQRNEEKNLSIQSFASFHKGQTYIGSAYPTME